MATGPALTLGELVFPLNKVTSSVGRKDRITNFVPDVDLSTIDQERSVSRRHAELAYERGTTTLRDIGSTNGSSVNGERLAHQVDRPLQDGDAVAFGGVNLTFARAGEWPEGVVAEWPPEVPELAAEETMIAGGTEETMVAAPFGGSEETVVAPPFGGTTEETLVAPPPTPDAGESAVPEPSEETATAPETASPAPAAPAAAAPDTVDAHVACTNHPHMTAVGLCPGCLDPFCVECLPERGDGLMVCNRCAGINYRLSAVAT
ncbi:MAG: hypothetical protein NVSMB17_12350 [Candidatus Dormibacteria bacterium]